MNNKQNFRTFAICDRCASFVRRWYTIDDTDLCVICYCEENKDKLDQEDYDILKDEEGGKDGRG